MASSLGSVVTAAATAILSSASVISLGAVSYRWSLLSESSTKDLSKLQSTLLEPLLAFSALCSLTGAELMASTPLLLWPLLHATLAICITYPLLPRSPRRGALLTCATFGNAGALPTALIPVLLSGPAISQAMLFVQVYLATWRLLLWSVVPALISSSTIKKNDDATGSALQESWRSWLFRLLLPPPSIGSLLGIALAFAPNKLRTLLISGPLSFCYSAAKMAGAASPPLVLINLGFALCGVGSTQKAAMTAGASSAAFTSREITIVCTVKMLVLPAIHLVLAPILHPTSQAPLSDPFHLVLLLQAAMPAAVSVQAIFQREGADTKPLGTMMLVQYALAMPTIVATIVFASMMHA